MPENPVNEELWQRVRLIPCGRCASYGAIGRNLSSPISGFLVGRRMRHIPDHLDIPWWRVVAKSGALPVSKLDPYLGKEQRDRLLAEGVPFLSEWVVDMAACEWDPRD